MSWKIHISYIVIGAILAVGAYFAVHSWQQEHDARLQAQAQITVNEANVKTLQDQIAANDAKAQQQIDSLTKLITQAKTQTPAQIVKEIPIVAPTLPVAPTIAPDESMNFPKQDILPLFTELANGKQCAVQLAASQADFTAEQAIVVQKDQEITVLKKPRGFWRKVGGALETFGIGVGVGIAVGHKI